jgi:hypothetical protein
MRRVAEIRAPTVGRAQLLQSLIVLRKLICTLAILALSLIFVASGQQRSERRGGYAIVLLRPRRGRLCGWRETRVARVERLYRPSWHSAVRVRGGSP